MHTQEQFLDLIESSKFKFKLLNLEGLPTPESIKISLKKNFLKDFDYKRNGIISVVENDLISVLDDLNRSKTVVIELMKKEQFTADQINHNIYYDVCSNLVESDSQRLKPLLANEFIYHSNITFIRNKNYIPLLKFLTVDLIEIINHELDEDYYNFLVEGFMKIPLYFDCDNLVINCNNIDGSFLESFRVFLKKNPKLYVHIIFVLDKNLINQENTYLTVNWIESNLNLS